MGQQQSFTANLEWRRAVKHFAPGEVDTEPILKAMVNPPTSFGLQPYKIVYATDNKIKEKLKPFCFNQSQITECHTLFILCARSDVEVCVEEYLKESGNEHYRDILVKFVSHLGDKTTWAMKQTYIALGFGLAAAAEHRIASCPMEGFLPGELAKFLELPENLVPCVLLAVGEEDENETLPPRFRFPENHLVSCLDYKAQTPKFA